MRPSSGRVSVNWQSFEREEIRGQTNHTGRPGGEARARTPGQFRRGIDAALCARNANRALATGGLGGVSQDTCLQGGADVACALAPVVVVNEDVHGQVQTGKIDKILEQSIKD